MTAGGAGLRRFTRPVPQAVQVAKAAQMERCEFCGTDLDDRHGHVVEVEQRSISCACRACYLLFTQDGAGGGRYRSVPDRYLRDRNNELTSTEWDELAIPVTPTFFFINSDLGRVVASYPSPAGATECELDLGAWDRLSTAHPLMAALTADVEALYVTRADGGLESFLVPIDVCYALVGKIRMEWRGLDGGEDVREALAAFLDDVRERSTALMIEA